MSIILQLLSWYALVFLSGLIFWLVFNEFFSGLIDKGFAISKVISLGILVLFLWLIGFVFKVPITNITCLTILFLFNVGLLSIFFLKKLKMPTMNINLRVLIVTELIFILTSAIGLFVVSLHPVIDNNTERLMDFAILNTLTTDSNLPAKDMWYAGSNLNYYYFGQFFFSVINKITGVNPYTGYLFALALIFGLSSSVIFSIGASIKKRMSYGFIAVGLTMFFANFDFIYQNLARYVDGSNEKLIGMVFAFITLIIIITLASSCLRNLKNKRFKYILLNLVLAWGYFIIINGPKIIIDIVSFFLSPTYAAPSFWDTSRVIPFTINEFPFYSLIVGDLHPHYIGLIFFTTNIALIFLDIKILTPKFLLSVYNKRFSELIRDSVVQKFLIIKALSLIIFGCGFATNSWELIVFGILFAIKDIIFALRIISHKLENIGFKWRSTALLIFIPILFDAVVYIGGFLLQIPFFSSVNLPVAGIKMNSELSPFREFAILWVIFFVFAFVGLGFLFTKLYTKLKLLSSEYYVLVLLITGIILVIFTELFFVSDLFYFDSYGYRRANTVFKVNYMGFIMFGIASSWIMYRLFKARKDQGFSFVKDVKSSVIGLFRTALVIVSIFTLLYVPISVGQWAKFNEGLKSRYTLDGFNASKTDNITYSDEKGYQYLTASKDVVDAGEYLKSIKKTDDVLLEAPGIAYRYTSVGSIFSTMPTVVGWVTHEAQWRKYTNLDKYKKDFEKNPVLRPLGPAEEEPKSDEERLRRYLNQNVLNYGDIRASEVDAAYRGQGLEETVKKYNVTYVWVGQYEKFKYGDTVEGNFRNDKFIKVYGNDSVSVYKWVK